MELTQEFSPAANQIKKYEPGIVYINDRSYQKSLVLFPDHLIENWPPKSLVEINASHLAQLFTGRKPDIVLLGTGEKLLIPNSEILQILFDKGVGFEYMDNRSACYTYTILAAEGRHVGLCLLLPG